MISKFFRDKPRDGFSCTSFPKSSPKRAFDWIEVLDIVERFCFERSSIDWAGSTIHVSLIGPGNTQFRFTKNPILLPNGCSCKSIKDTKPLPQPRSTMVLLAFRIPESHFDFFQNIRIVNVNINYHISYQPICKCDKLRKIQS